MSLFGSIQLANNALRSTQIGLQVVGQNIANANTPGYIREEVQFASAPTQRAGNLLLGMGVTVQGVVQKIDAFLEDRLRGSTSDRVSAETQEQTFQQMEALIGELGDTDLSTALNNFFASVNEILNQPESIPIRNLAMLKSKALAGDINRLATRVDDLRAGVNERVTNIADDINRISDEVGRLNIRIAQVEGGDTSKSDAVGLRDQRHVLLGDLSKLVGVRVEEQTSGAVNVFVGGDYLVFEGEVQHVGVSYSSDRGIAIGNLVISDNQSPLRASSGELAGVLLSRDQVLGGFLDKLDDFAKTLAYEFNKVYSAGQGLNGFSALTSEFGTSDANAALDAAGLPFTPVNGSFDVQVYSKTTGLTQTTHVEVDLNGLDHDTTLADLAAKLDGVSGISATFNTSGQLELKSDSSDQVFAFSGDTSGLLASLGLNTFFSGTAARNLGVSKPVSDDPGKFAASRGGIGADTAGAVELAAFLDRPLESQGGDSLSTLYDRVTSRLTQDATIAKSVAEGFRVFEDGLRGQSLAISGVSLDEEAVRMIGYQRAFQASARYIATLSELMEVLVNL